MKYKDVLPGKIIRYEEKCYLTVRDTTNPNARPCVTISTFVLLELNWEAEVEVLGDMYRIFHEWEVKYKLNGEE